VRADHRHAHVLHGVLNLRRGAILWRITAEWGQETHQAFLAMRRSHWRGWPIILCEDRGAPHLATPRRHVAQELHIARRFLPKAPPERNAMDHRWRPVQGRGLANWPAQSIDASADSACR
jgi:hypothetical protein